MFEKTVLRRTDQGVPVSPGRLAEALLFYRSVHLILDAGTIGHLAKSLGVGTFLDLLKRPDVTAVFLGTMSGVMTNPVGEALKVHKFVLFSAGGTAEELERIKTEKRFAKWDHLVIHLRRQGFIEKDISKIVDALKAHVPRRDLSTDFSSAKIESLALADAQDRSLLGQVARIALRNSLPEEVIPEPFKFEAVDSDLGLYVFTNLDLQALEQRRQQIYSDRAPINEAMVLSLLFDARIDLALSAHYGGDFATSPLMSQIIQVRYSEAFRRGEINREQIQDFQTVVLEDFPTLAEAIDSGARSFDEFLRLLDRADRFKKWVDTIHPDHGAAAAYLKEAARQDWIQGGAAKALRYVIGLGMNLPQVGPAISQGWTVLDTFFVDKIFGGWRPSHFVDAKLKPFVDG